MFASDTDDKALLVSSIEHHVAYDRACHNLYNIAKLFEKATTVMQEGGLCEKVNDMKAKAMKCMEAMCG
jgi:hypothetical protein